MYYHEHIGNQTGGEHPSKDIIGSYSRSLAGKRVALGISASVAAVKSVDIARLLMRYGAEVYAVMSDEAQRLIHPNLLHWATGNPVVSKLSGAVEHVYLGGNVADKVDLLLIAPATANTIGKAAHGIDDTPVPPSLPPPSVRGSPYAWFRPCMAPCTTIPLSPKTSKS